MSLEELRHKIDSLDQKIIQLLNDRAEICQEIGHYKKQHNKAIYSSSREKQVYDRINQLNKGPMPSSGLEAIYREIMSSSLALEKELHIAYFGNEGSFTHSAANKKFGSQVTYVPYGTIPEIFNAVEHEECDYGVVPIENSVEGAVTHTFDVLADSDLKICAQILLKVSHCLMANTDSLKNIKQVYSHPQVFGQCRNWLYKNMPKVEEIAIGSTSEAAEKVAKTKTAAVIGPALLAQIHGLKILKNNIQDIAHNTTRFLVLSVHDVPPSGKDRTSIMFSIKDKVGALHDMLTPFYQNKINLTKIESRPSKRKAWDYLFFVDFSGHQEDANVKKALGQLEGMCNYLKILGSYPEIG